MKIHIHTPSFFPQLVGMTYAADAHARILTSLGADVTVWVAGKQVDHIDPSQPFDVQYSEISGSGLPWSKLNGDIASVFDNAQISKPDIVIAEGWYTPAALLLPQLKKFCRHAVLASHGAANISRRDHSISEFIRSSAYRFAEKFSRHDILKAISAALILSDYEGDERFADIQDYKKHNIPTFICPNYSSYHPNIFPRKLGSGRRLVHIGEMTENKNQELGVSIISQLPSPYELTFIYPNENKYSYYIKNLVSKYGLENRVKYVIGKQRDELEKLMDDFDLLLILSHSEAQPIVAVDAVAKAVPFVSTPVGCMAQFEGGLISTKSEFVKNIQKIFYDANSYQKYSTSALKYYQNHLCLEVAKLSLDRMINNLAKT